VPDNAKSSNQTEATEVKTAVMERKSVFLPEEVPPTAKAAVTTNGGKSAEAIVLRSIEEGPNQ
jgi:hypothetical protein